MPTNLHPEALGGVFCLSGLQDREYWPACHKPFFNDWRKTMEEKPKAVITPEYLRLKAMLSPGELAELAGISHDTVRRIERGMTKHLCAKTLFSISDAIKKHLAMIGSDFQHEFNEDMYLRAAMERRSS